MSFTPRTSNNGMSIIPSPFNSNYYTGAVTSGYWYTKSNANTYQCTGYCMSRLGEIANEPVTSFKSYVNNPKYRMFTRNGYGNANEWYNDTKWDKSTDKTTPKLGCVVCYSSYPNDGGGGHVQIVEKIDGSTIYVSQNSTSYGSNFLTAINVNDLSPSGDKKFMGYIYNPYVTDEPTPGGDDVVEFTNNDSYAYIRWNGYKENSGYNYKLQLVAPYFALAGDPNSVTDDSMSGWELVARINGGFFFAEGSSYFANGIERQHSTWNEIDDSEYDNVLAIGGDYSTNTRLVAKSQSEMKSYGDNLIWCLTGGISLSGGSYISTDVNVSRGHSFIGYNGDEIIMGVSKNGVSGETLRNYISGLGFTGVELDGGGSTVFNYWGTNYSTNYDGRKVKNVICLYRKKKEIPKYTVTLNAEPTEGGFVTGSGTYTQGSTVVISATPNDKYEFVKWSDGSTDMQRTFTSISDNITLTAYFEKKKGILITGSMGIDFQILY